MPDDKDSIALYTEEPNVKLLVQEFQRAGASGNFFSQIRDNEETRLARWDGQSADGRKWDENMEEGEEAFPWDGASDTRCFQADSVCNERAAVKATAFWRAELRVSPVGPEDATDSSCATTYIDWLRYGRLSSELVDEVDLSAQCDEEAGWFINHITWVREVSKKPQRVKLSELATIAQAFQQQIEQGQLDMASLDPKQAEMLQAAMIYPQLIANPELEAQAAEVTRYMYRAYMEKTLAKSLYDDIGDLSVRSAKRAVRELRGDGETMMPSPYLCKNQPCIKTLRPWVDVVIPGYAVDIESSPYVFLPMYYEESDVRARVLSDGWDSKWAEEVIKTKGKKSQWKLDEYSRKLTWNVADNSEDNQIEIVCAYVRQVDDDGVTCITYVYFSPHYTGDDFTKHAYGLSELLNFPGGRYPLRLCRREMRDRCIITSRGTPEVLSTSQREEKVQHDAIADSTSLAVIPPILEPKGSLGQNYKYGPAQRNIVTVGREPRFMEVPTQGIGAAADYLHRIEYRKNRYFGLFHEEIPPQLSQLMMEQAVRRFLNVWGLSLYDAYQLSCQFAPELVERVTGERPPIIDDAHTGANDLTLHFDVGMLDPELWVKKLEAFGKLLTEDFAGVIDRAKYVAIKARLIDHRLYKELVMSQAPASERLLVEVRNELTAMFAGSQPMIKDASNDPTAPSRLQYAQQTLSQNQKMLMALDPQVAMEVLGQQYGQQYMMQQQMMQQQGMQQQSQPDPMFTQFIQAYFQNLQMASDQQANKQTGRTGVNQNQ